MIKQTSLTTSRRTFIKSAGALAATSGLAMAAPALAADNDTASSVNDITWDEEHELVIMGAGFAGLNTAAAAIADCGATDVVVYEKGDVPGGCSPFSVCRFTYTTPEYRDDFITYMKLLDRNATTVPDDVYEAFADGVIDAIDWVTSLGASPDEMVVEAPGSCSPTQPGGYPEYPELDGAESIGNFQVGQAEGATGPTSFYLFLQQWLEGHADACAINYATPVTALVQDPATKEVLGVVVESDGASKYVRATKGVVMCCGGFENDPEMLREYLGFDEIGSNGARLNTGDGHRICMRIGAQMWHMHQLSGPMLAAQGVKGENSVKYNAAKGITVGCNGRRYFDDSGYAGGTGMVEFVGYRTRPLSLGDDSRHGLANFGGVWSFPQLHDSWFVCDAAALTDGGIAVPGFNGDAADSGEVYQADTLTELAEQLGFPAGCLEQTVEDWNLMVDAGHDFAFYRLPSRLTKVDAGPYYAVPLKVRHLNTDGGPVRSAKAEVMDIDGKPIPHLWSAGEFGSITGACYQGGCNISEGNVFGRIAAHEAYGVK